VTSFASELDALIETWMAKGETPEDILRALDGACSDVEGLCETHETKVEEDEG
jgi:hypothetical protein